MAEIETFNLKLKIMDIECFSVLVSALGAWADEMAGRDNLTPAERALFDAAVAADQGLS